MLRLLIDTPRWLLLAALVYAPWAFGATRDWTIQALDVLLGIILALWLGGCALRRSLPVIHPVPLTAAALLILQGWWMVFNAKFDYDPNTLKFAELSPWLSWAPGSLHKSASLPATIHLSLLLGVGCFCCDLARRSLWRMRLLRTVCFTGLSIVVLGLAQRLTGAPGIFWGPPNQGETFFATYRYHANAGSFLNIIWPIAAGFAFVASKEESPLRRRLFWSGAFTLCLAAVLMNASRAANFIAILLLLAWGIGFLIRMKSQAEGIISPAAIVAMLLAVLIALAGTATLGGLDASWRRWAKFNAELTTQNERLLVAGACLKMIPEAGCFGFGPRTFQTAFPYFTNELEDRISGIWVDAHNDYLQTAIEWGWLGALIWAAYILGGVIFSWLYFNRSRMSWRDRCLYAAVLTALLSVLAHALVDFPLQVASIQLYVIALLGLFWSCRSWFEKPESVIRMERSRETIQH